MRDLATLHRLPELQHAGVSALKIEGRLKTADWVGRAVALYHRALAGEDPATLTAQIDALGAYTGRAMTCGYLDGARSALTGLSGRQAASSQSPTPDPDQASKPTYSFVPDAGDPARYSLTIDVTDKRIDCRCEYCGRATRWDLPRTLVRRAGRAVTIAELFAHLAAQPLLDCQLQEPQTNAPDFALVPRTVNAITEQITLAIRRTRKAPDDQVRIDLPPEVRTLLTKTPPAPANDRKLGDRPDRARLDAPAVVAFLAGVKDRRPAAILVEVPDAEALDRLLPHCRGIEVVAALPQVFFEADIPALSALLARCARTGLAVEANSWGGVYLAVHAGCRVETGPGLPVLNSLAARALAEHGATCVTLSLEADRVQLEEVTAHGPVPCALTVFGRPPLLVSRAQLDPSWLGRTFTDRRDLRLTPRLERGLWVFRPTDPFDLRGVGNPRVRVRHLVADLTAAPDPAHDWLAPPDPAHRALRFNYDRSLA
jgi:hypothetical protein